MTVLRVMTAGESHGPAILAIVEGLPAGVPVSRGDLDRQLGRRQLGYGRGGRMQIERDRVSVLSGIRGGRTMGSPVAMMVENRDFDRWKDTMSAWSPAGEDGAFTRARPGHADLAGALKYGHHDLRDVLERASARETVARTAAGALAAVLLGHLGMAVGSHVVRVGGVEAGDVVPPGETETTLREWQDRVDASPLRCGDHGATGDMVSAVDRARDAGYSLGGVFEIVTTRLPPGLGSHVHPDRRLDGQLAGALMSIPGVKGVEIGLGFSVAGLTGRESHDEMVPGPLGPRRLSNRAGGLEGGVTTGEALVIRCAMKPISTQTRPLRTVDLATGRAASAHVERADTCAVPAAGVVGEAETALVLARAVLDKFGGDSLGETARNMESYLQEVARRWQGTT